MIGPWTSALFWELLDLDSGSWKNKQKHFSDAISKRHFQLNDDVYADYVENLLNDISEEPDDTFAYGDDSKYEWWKFYLFVGKCDWNF